MFIFCNSIPGQLVWLMKQNFIKKIWNWFVYAIIYNLDTNACSWMSLYELIIEKKIKVLPTWDLSECYQQKVTQPRFPQVGWLVQICCMVIQQKDNTAAVGRDLHNWRQGRQHSWPSGRSLMHSVWRVDCLCAVRVRSRHQGKMGLRQESRDKVKN